MRLTLSKTGKLYDGLIRAAAERDRAVSQLPHASEKKAFERALTKLAGQARR